MDTTEGMTLTMTRKACHIAAKNGWTAEQIQDTFATPKAIYESKQREGQWRIAGKEMVLVGFPVDNTRFHAITVWVNGSTAPVKE
jgi:hypothetical protein